MTQSKPFMRVTDRGKGKKRLAQGTSFDPQNNSASYYYIFLFFFFFVKEKP